MSSTIFNGTSRYSTDFQQVITRAVNIASLPITQLSQQKLKLQDQVTALNGLQASYSAVASVLAGIGTAASSGSIRATSGDSSIASPTVSGSPLAGTYTIDVTSVGTPSTAVSSATLPKITDPSSGGLSTASSITLSINGVDTQLAPGDNSLNSLAAAINNANAGAEATVVNIGGPNAADYRLFLKSSGLGGDTISLKDGTSELLDPLSTGTPAVYTVNGQPSGGISSNSRTVTIAPGLNVDLKGFGTTEIIVSRSTTSLQNALSGFVATFNAAVDATDAQRGKSGGALSGDSIVSSLAGALRNVVSYDTGSSSGIKGLADLGIQFDKSGKLTFDATVVSAFSAGQLASAASFLGDSTTGFLGFATNTLSGVADSTNGIIKASVTSVQETITDEQNRIDDTQRRVDTLRTNLQAKMAAADALIASLEQQVSYFTALFQAERDAARSSN